MEKVKRTPAKLSKLVQSFGLEVIWKGRDYDTREITISDVNRPALQLVGFYDYFEPRRLQILGKAEMTFLRAMSPQERTEVFDHLLRCEIPALIIYESLYGNSEPNYGLSSAMSMFLFAFLLIATVLNFRAQSKSD